VSEETLGVEFFDRSVHTVARDLIGCRLFYEGRGGVIVETESYERDDPACHAYVGLTDRTEVLFGAPGRAYVYLSYGIHSLLNFVAEPDGDAAAVLIRAIEPTHGLAAMRERRGRRPDGELCSGPGKLTEALGVGLEANGAALDADPFRLLCRHIDWRGEIVTGPRIGITKAVDRPWRFCLAGSPHVSKPRPSPSPDAGAEETALYYPGAEAPPLIPPLGSGAASSGAASSGAASGSAASGSGAGASSGAASSGSE
jgi:DNA-3-methyladenine glycosylase